MTPIVWVKEYKANDLLPVPGIKGRFKRYVDGRETGAHLIHGLGMLGELIKVVGVTLTKRLEQVIRSHPLGHVLSPSNVGFQTRRGAQLVLDTTSDFWDEARESRERTL